MCNWSCLSLLIICSSAAVFVNTVARLEAKVTQLGGGDERVDQLMNTVARLEAKVTQLEAERSTKRSDNCNCKSAMLCNMTGIWIQS